MDAFSRSSKCSIPASQKKDRPALQIIEIAEADGRLLPGQTVVELTSGNMGTGLAIVCGNRGYPFVAVMSKGNSAERARMMAALGAEVILVDQCPQSKTGPEIWAQSGGKITAFCDFVGSGGNHAEVARCLFGAGDIDIPNACQLTT